MPIPTPTLKSDTLISYQRCVGFFGVTSQDDNERDWHHISSIRFQPEPWLSMLSPPRLNRFSLLGSMKNNHQRPWSNATVVADFGWTPALSIPDPIEKMDPSKFREFVEKKRIRSYELVTLRPFHHGRKSSNLTPLVQPSKLSPLASGLKAGWYWQSHTRKTWENCLKRREWTLPGCSTGFWTMPAEVCTCDTTGSNEKIRSNYRRWWSLARQLKKCTAQIGLSPRSDWDRSTSCEPKQPPQHRSKPDISLCWLVYRDPCNGLL